MLQGYNDLIAGVLICQRLLVRHLEDHGVLPKGSFREALEKHLASVSPAHRDGMTYEPVRLLIKALGKPDAGAGSAWGSPWGSPWGKRIENAAPESCSGALSNPDTGREA